MENPSDPAVDALAKLIEEKFGADAAEVFRIQSGPLVWNNQGAICCPSHGPYRGTDTWKNEQWRDVTPGARILWLQELGKVMVCETCAAIGARRVQ